MSTTSRRKDVVRFEGNNASVRLRWLELDVSGGTAEIAEGFRSLAAALRSNGGTRATLSPAEVKVSAPTPVAVVDPDSGPDQDEAHTAAPENSAVAAEPSEARASSSETEDRRRRSAPKAPRFLNDLDLTKTTLQLSAFVEQKNNPAGDMERYAVIAVWFKEQLGIPEITIDHIFTAYKALGWQAQLPPDLGQTFRNLKSNKNWFDRGSERGSYKINWNGETAVAKMGAPKS